MGIWEGFTVTEMRRADKVIKRIESRLKIGAK